MRKKILIGFICLLAQFAINGQSLLVGSMEDLNARNLQLLGEYDSTVSFMIRPLMKKKTCPSKKIYKEILPFTFLQQLNTHHPYGWNDGSLIKAKSYQLQLAGGAYWSYGPVELQIRPEMVMALNPHYASESVFGRTPANKGYYQKLFAGQSRLSIAAGSLAAGISTENLWWGPGIHSALLMSNNAPGFLHGFLRTRKPLKTPVANIEFQLMGAKLTDDPDMPFENKMQLQGSLNKNNWRYYNAYVFTLNPKWMPGVFVGMSRGMQRRWQEVKSGSASMSFLKRYVPVFANSFQKQTNIGDDTLNVDQLASFFLRWVLPKVHTEFYIEYGYNDYGQNTRDYLMSPTHSAAYLLGFKKSAPLANDQYLHIGLELTQMSQSPDYIIRDAGNWYEHGQVSQGYTNQNQIMGAGAAFGSNLQSLSATLEKRKNRSSMGFLLERLEHDPLSSHVKWTDIGLGFLPNWQHGSIGLQAKLECIYSNNYGWVQGVDKFNLHAKLLISYLF